MPLFPDDPQAVTVLAPALADIEAVLEVLGPLGTGDVFCAAAPEDDEDDYSDLDSDDAGTVGESFPYYSATFSDTVATFVVEVERADPASPRTGYVVRVAGSGPGTDRLRYRLAKAVAAATEGTPVDAQGAPMELSAPAQDPFGALW